jgi:hypothetical protein
VTFHWRRADGSELKPLRWLHEEGPGPKAPAPKLPDHYADNPPQGVETYVAAINAHDGNTICELFTSDFRSRFSRSDAPCWQLVGAHIGYGEEGSTPLFQHADLLHVGKGYTKTNYGARFAAVPIDVRLRYRAQRYSSELKTFQIHDVVWFRKTPDGWRMAKASKTLYAAFSGNVPADVLAVPDPYAVKHKREAEAAKRRRDARAKARSDRSTRVVPVRRVPCPGRLTTVRDPIGDVREQNPPRSGEEAAARALRARVDLRRMGVALRGRRACVVFEFRRRPAAGERVWLALEYKPPEGDEYGDSLAVWFAKDGLHAGRAVGGAGLYAPADATVSLRGVTLSVSFVLRPAMPLARGAVLRRLYWDVGVFGGSTNPPLADGETVPGRTGADQYEVRQSDGKIFKRY